MHLSVDERHQERTNSHRELILNVTDEAEYSKENMGHHS